MDGAHRLRSSLIASLSRLWAVGSRLPAPLRRRLNALPGMGALRRRATGAPGGPDPAPGSPRPVVYLPTWATWDAMRQRPQYLMAAFARAGHPVYFVDPRERSPRRVDGVHIVPDLGPVPARNVLLYVHFAPLVTMHDLFEDAVLWYDILDDLTIYDRDEEGMPSHRTVAHHHPEAMRLATVVTASAPALRERYRTEEGPVLLVPNGVEVERFAADRSRPDDLPRSNGLTIGYHGAIAEWFDGALVAELARSRPGDLFVLVGPVMGGGADQVARLTGLDNVHLIGERSPDEIAAYVRGFDVGLIPFVVNRMTRGVSPLKMYEYLAAGVPVVATPLPACVEHPLVRVAASATAFDEEISMAILQGADPRFLAAASEAAAAASWDERVAIVRRALGEHDGLVVPA